MENMSEDLYPLALLMDELKHDDISNRIEAMKKLDTIAIALGPERTVNELLLFLNEVAQDDEEEVFSVMASKLGGFLPLIGGNENCEPLIHILVILASMEEPIVRERAIDSLVHISRELTTQQVTDIYLPIIYSLSEGNWFSKKVASSGLCKAVLARVDSKTRVDLLKTYYKLICDESPMVRRGAATNFPSLIDDLTTLTRDHPNSENKINQKDWEIVSQIFQHLINDEQDSVKFLSIDVLISILRYFQVVKEDKHNNEFLKSSLKLIKDESWRVRYTAADRFSKISEMFSTNEGDLSKLIEPMILLMNDNEGEVRRAICKQIAPFCEHLNKFPLTREIIAGKITPVLDSLSQDPQESVRSSLASSIAQLAPILGKQGTIDKLFPIFLIMLKDECPEVRLNIISNLSVVSEIVGINLLSINLLPAITELAQDSKWRIRLAIIEYIPKLAKQLGESFFNLELLVLCLSWLWDPVFAIREAAVEALKELTLVFGSDWADQHILSRLINGSTMKSKEDMVEGEGENKIVLSNFIIRITCLFTVTRLSTVVDSKIVVDKILPFLNNFVDDSVPNIRFNIAKSYGVIVEAFINSNIPKADIETLVEREMSPNLAQFQRDEDVDVRFFANQTSEKIEKLLKNYQAQ